MTARFDFPLVMGCHPTSRGFGWTLMRGPHEPVDWGLAYVRGDRQRGNRRKLEKLLDRYRPDALVVEAGGTDRKPGAAPFELTLRSVAEAYGVEVRALERQTLHTVLRLPDEATRDDVALRVAQRLAALGHRLPHPRRAWESADRRLALFNAAALALGYWKTPERS